MKDEIKPPTPAETKNTDPKVEAGRENWVFLGVVSAVLIGLFIFTIYNDPAMQTPPGLIILSVLMLLHLGLYWGMLRMPQDEGTPWIIYLVVQTVLALAIIIYTRQQVMVFGLIAPLIGLSVGALRNRRQAAGAVVIYIALMGWALFLLEGTDALINSSLFIIPMVVFVVIYVVLFNRQVEARAEAQALLEELEVAHRELASYAAQVEDLTLTTERQRLARELHDTLAQGLAGLILQLEAADAQLENGQTKRAREIVQQAMRRARTTLEDARRAIDDLRAEPTAQTDLDDAIRHETERFSRSTGIPCEMDITLEAQPTEMVSEHAQRIVSEALTNVAQHAQASQVWVAAHDSNGQLEIVVRDDGQGISEDSQNTPSGHYGLIGMRERARLAGGSLAIDSEPGVGTTIRIVLPMTPKEEGHHAG